MRDFAAIDFETANGKRSSVALAYAEPCAVIAIQILQYIIKHNRLI